jgi:transcriptional regulator with XRE-family HTH domain
MSVGDRIRFVRGNQSQEEFGVLFHVHRNTVRAWENNESMPQGETITQFYDLLNVNLNWLFTGNGEPYIDESG